METQTELFKTENKNYFPDIIAQTKAKNALSLHLDGFYANRFLPPLLIIGARGMGKTEFLKSISDNIIDIHGNKRKTLLINCASIPNLESFVNQLVIPFQGQEITYLLDEVHALNKEVGNWMLNVINPNKEKKSNNSYNQIVYEWDLTKTSFISATTSPERLSEALKSRHERIDLEEYSDIDLIKILYSQLPNIIFLNNIELDIVSVCRSTPREVVKMSHKIGQFCDIKGKNYFDKLGWDELSQRAGINYLGLNSHEILHLKSLKECGDLTLNMLSAKLRLDRYTIQNDIERFLFEKSLITVDVKRKLTAKGREILKKIP